MARVLFDRNVPDQLLRYLSEHTVRTTDDMGWSELFNGDLLTAAEADKFDVLVTADQNITYQQNMKGRVISMVVLGTNRRSLLEAHPEKLAWAVNAAKPGSYEFLAYELPPKPKFVRRPGGPTT